MKNFKNNKAFTLAEIIIVIVILGIISSITIPALVRNQIEAQNRTRIKKAMTVYDTVINKMVVENNLKSNDAFYSSNPNDNTAFAPQNNCTRTSAYFKINRTLDDDNGTNCRFCSSDNVCWDISNILKPIIGIGEEGITNENSNNRYRMFAHFGDNGELRVDDLAYEEQHDYLTDAEKEELVATYNFANNKLNDKENIYVDKEFDKVYGDLINNKFYLNTLCQRGDEISNCFTPLNTGRAYIFINSEIVASVPMAPGAVMVGIMNGDENIPAWFIRTVDETKVNEHCDLFRKNCSSCDASGMGVSAWSENTVNACKKLGYRNCDETNKQCTK